MKRTIVSAVLSCLTWGGGVFAQEHETRFPLASPNGRYVIKTDDQGETKMRLVEQSSGKTLASLDRDTLGQWSVDEARWSPDSRAVVLAVQHTKNTDLYIYRKDDAKFTETEQPNWPDGLFAKEPSKRHASLRHGDFYIYLGQWRGNDQLELQMEQNDVSNDLSDEPPLHKTVILSVSGNDKPSVAVLGDKPKGESTPQEQPKAGSDLPDQQLNEVYARLRQKLSASGKAHLKQEEIQWLAQRDRLTDPAEKQRFVEARVKELQKRLAELK